MARLRHLVVVVPGIGGSVLTGTGSGGGGYSLTTRGLAGTLVRPARLDLDRYPPLRPTELVSDFTALAPLLTLPGYQRIDQHLRNAFDDPVVHTYQPAQDVPERTDVLRFPYDFRRSVAVAAHELDTAVDKALRHRGVRAPARPVIIVAHSMGGLVARYWVAVLDGWRRCQAVITLGTPYRGAPKALDWLVNGVGVGPLRDPRGTRVIRRWPSVYELLPQYPAVWDTATQAAVELTKLPDGLLATRPALAGYADTFAAMSADGRAVHDEIARRWAARDPAELPKMVPFLARGHATLNLATLESGRLRVSKDDPPWRGNVGWRGDGTVPFLCAVPHELGDRQDVWRVVAERHGPLGSIHDPVEVLRSYAGDPVPVRGGPLPDRPWLGLDLDEFTLSTMETPLGVALLPDSLTGGPAWLTVTPVAGSPVAVTPIAGTPGAVHQGRLTAATPEPGARPGAGEPAAWTGTLPPLPAGRYEVAVEVTDVPGNGVVAASTSLTVLDAADLTDLSGPDELTGPDGPDEPGVVG